MEAGSARGTRRARRVWLVAGTAGAVLVVGGGIGAALSAGGNGTAAHAGPTSPTTRSTPTLTPTTGAPTTTSAAPTTTTRATAPPSTVDPAIVALDARLHAAFQGFSGCLLVTRGGSVVYSANAALPLAPASTEKLLTAAAAISTLGPGFRFETDVVASAAPVAGTVGDLWMVGSGDPTISSPEYAASLAAIPELRGYPATSLSSLADAVAAAGIKTVTNGIHGDDSRYDRTRYLPSWPAFYATDPDIGPMSALGVNQGFTAWSPRLVPAADPTAFAASELARLLGPRGVHAAGAADATAPAQRVVVARVYSAPLATIVAEMLRVSDNYMAELLTKEMSRRSGGSGTTFGGVEVTAQIARALGLPVSGLHLVDGSGLDHGNRSTCQLELAALNLGYRGAFSPLSTGLAEAGQTGTLINRYVNTPLQGHLEAKTGSIDGVMSMVGHEEAGHPLSFALIVNGTFSWAQGAALEDRVLAALSQY